jgi:hypothetical protein
MLRWGTLLILGTLISKGYAAEVEFFTAGPQVIHQYFKTATPQDTASAFVPNGDVALIRFPPAFAAMIAAHINSARDLGYYQEISLTDFYHGHMINRGPQSDFATPEDYLANLSVILYHSSEYNGRWEQNDRVPRSFLGWLDGRAQVEPAIDYAHLTGPKLKNYQTSGTVRPIDLVTGTPSLSQIEWRENEDPAIIPTLNLCQGERCRICQIDTQFYILKSETPGAPPETFFYCLFQPDEGTLAFSFQRRPASQLSSAAM